MYCVYIYIYALVNLCVTKLRKKLGVEVDGTTPERVEMMIFCTVFQGFIHLRWCRISRHHPNLAGICWQLGEGSGKPAAISILTSE